MIEGGEVTRIDQPRPHPRSTLFRDEIKKLGNVNLDAIEEETAARGPQRGPHQAGRRHRRRPQQLTELIDKLNIASRERFGEVFDTIQQHFAGQDGMFRKLFGGGQAEVRLMPLVKEVETPDGARRS